MVRHSRSRAASCRRVTVRVGVGVGLRVGVRVRVGVSSRAATCRRVRASPPCATVRPGSVLARVGVEVRDRDRGRGRGRVRVRVRVTARGGRQRGIEERDCDTLVPGVELPPG